MEKVLRALSVFVLFKFSYSRLTDKPKNPVFFFFLFFAFTLKNSMQ